MTKPRRRRLSAALAGGVLALLTGCAGTNSASTATSGVIGQVCCVAAADAPASMVNGVSSAYNGWDTAMITWLAPHDAVASQMAGLATARSHNATVRAIAAQTDTETQQRYLTLAGFATAWGQPAPDTDPSDATGHDHGSGTSELSDVDALTKASAPGFDKLFLTLMIAHHKAALSIAQATVTNGVNPQDQAFARALLTSQQAEIDTMTKALATV